MEIQGLYTSVRSIRRGGQSADHQARRDERSDRASVGEAYGREGLERDPDDHRLAGAGLKS